MDTALFSEDGGHLVTAAGSEYIVWDLEQRSIVTQTGAMGGVPVAIRGDGGALVVRGTTPGGEPATFIHDLHGNDRHRLIDGHVDAAEYGAGGILVTASGRTAQVWGRELRPLGASLVGHLGAIRHIAIRADGQFVATASADQTVRIWNAPTGLEWMAHSVGGDSESVTFSSDGERVVVGAGFGTPAIRSWPVDVLEMARTSVRRQLTQDERERFGIGTVEERAFLAERAAMERWLRRMELALQPLEVESGSREVTVEVVEEQLAQLVEERENASWRPDVENDALQRVRDLNRRHGFDRPDELGARAAVESAAGDTAAAVRSLEESIDRGNENSAVAERLSTLRDRVAPDLVSFASIDAALGSGRSLIPVGAMWKYWPGSRGAPTEDLSWSVPGFADAEWSEGPSGFGYGDGDDRTIIADMQGNYSVLWTRHEFDIERVADVKSLTLTVTVDDGFVAFLNGVEIHRERAERVGAVPGTSDTASEYARDPGETVVVDVSPSRLRPGRNALGVVGLNHSLTSSDLTLEASLDASVSGSIESERARFRKFLENETGIDHSLRVAYFEARVAERAGDVDRALAKFRELRRFVPASTEPALGVVRCLLAKDQRQQAKGEIEAAIRSGVVGSVRVWNQWFELVTADGTPATIRGAEEFVESILARRERVASRAADLEWVLGRLARGETLRILSGRAAGVSDRAAGDWSSDRFYYGGDPAGVSAADRMVGGTERPHVYGGARSFWREGGYRIPLPAGIYRLRLHFAELGLLGSARRSFDVEIEGRMVLGDYSPSGGPGLAKPDVQEFDVEVADGSLDIVLRTRRLRAQIVAVEVMQRSVGAPEK